MIRFFLEHFYRIEDYLLIGGPVMPSLMILSVVMWTLIINRILFFRRLYRKNMTRREAREYVENGELPDPREYRGAIAMLVTGFLKRRGGQEGRQDRFLLDETVIGLVSYLNQHLGLIGTLAALAPLLGLLGTVTGMITTFEIIAVFGTGNARAMAGGISEALITTQTGLLIAIPGLYMSNFLNRRAENLKQRIASVGIYLRRHI